MVASVLIRINSSQSPHPLKVHARFSMPQLQGRSK